MTHQKIHFDSLDALCAAAISPSTWGGRRDSVIGDFAFTGTRSMDEAQSFARHGWPQGLSKMTLALDHISASAGAVLSAPAYSLDVAGAFPCVPAACAGDPMNMFNPAPVSERARPVLRIATSTALPGNYTPEEVFNYGAGLVAIIDALEQSGLSVELMTCRANRSTNGCPDTLTITVKIKGAGEALDKERLAFCLGSASYNRRLHFGAVEALATRKPWVDSFGTGRIPEHGKDVDSDVTVLPGPTMFGSGSPQLRTPAAAFKAMLPQVMKLLQDRHAGLPPFLIEHTDKAA